MTEQRIKPDAIVYVVDDEEDVRESLRMLIRSVGLKVEVCASAREFLDSYVPGQPGCLVLDVRMPGMSGLELQDQLAAHHITLPVIIISGHGDVPMVVRAMKSGAIDFIEKPFNDQLLLDRVQHLITLDLEAHQSRQRQGAIQARLARLTPREHEVMLRVIAGKLNKVIASELGVSTRTVEIHRARVMEKLSARSVGELVQMAISCGVAPSAPRVP
jgi:two-component system, LuxR family, response regulator FixJ